MADRSNEPGLRPSPKSPREAIEPEQAPPPPSRSRHVRHPVIMVLNLMMTLLVVGVIAVGGVLYWGKSKFEEPGPLAADRTVIIPNGATLDSITTLLKRNGVISEGWVFSTGVQVYKQANKLKAGEYLFKARASMGDVMETIVQGKAILHSVTVPEGYSSKQIVAKLMEQDLLTGDIEVVPEEGTLLPETYKYTRGTTRQQMIDKMKAAHDRAVKEIWGRRAENLPIKTPEEMVILASIVEKETGKADERTRVAGVFVNRLNKGMRLESDPTILYGLYGGDAWDRSRTLYRSELNKENPYSTYQINGLPPGPIANPGRAALEAVVNPSRTNDLFFVADGTGGHAFAETLDDHNRNVNRWRKVERDRKAAREAQEKEAAAEKAAAEKADAETAEGGDAAAEDKPAAN
ncbi:MAG: endolytic transglycosylase MltG [Hyphomicrobiales bacterium]|nr:MAG: endolytic transglycosylase MltG [Hyphomicrobiales bacterium]